MKATQDKQTGNAALVDRGASWLPEADIRLSSLLAPTNDGERMRDEGDDGKQRELFDLDARLEAKSPAVSPPVSLVSDTLSNYRVDERADEPKLAEPGTPGNLGLYTPFLERLEQLTNKTPATPEQILRALGINKAQLNEWLKRAVAERRVKKLSKPVRYIWASGMAEQSPLFAPSECKLNDSC